MPGRRPGAELLLGEERRAPARARPRANRATPCRCGCARRARAAWRNSGRSRAAASSRPRSGASGRSSGVSAETLTDTFARGSGPPRRARAPAARASARGGRELLERLAAPRGVAVGLGGVTVASPSRSTELATPRSHRRRSTPSAAAGRLADDEPVGHVPAPRLRRRRRARCAPPGVGDPHRGGDRRRRVGDLLEEPRAGAGRGRRASGRPARRRRTGTAPPAARGRSEASSIARASIARTGWRRARRERRRAARRRSGGCRARAARAPARPLLASPRPRLRAGRRWRRRARSPPSSCRGRAAPHRPAAAAPQPEQPLGVQQVDDHRDVDRGSR